MNWMNISVDPWFYFWFNPYLNPPRRPQPRPTHKTFCHLHSLITYFFWNHAQELNLTSWDAWNWVKWNMLLSLILVHINISSVLEFLTYALSMYVVTFTLISNLATDYIQKRIGEPGLFSFEYNLSPKLISK